MIGGPAHFIRAATALALAGTLFCGASGASAATGSTTATGTLISPLAVVKTDDLNFGGLISSSTAGTATISAATDTRTTAGGVTPAGGSTSAAHFTAAGRIGALALISLPGSITVTRGGGAETMTVTGITTNGGTLRVLPLTGTIDVAVGGTLNVAANQVAGNYVGTFTVNILYF